MAPPDRELLSIADLPRLLADVAGLAEHPWSVDPSVRVPVAQFDAPGIPGHPKIQEALDLWGLGHEAGERLCTSFACATDGRLKLIRRLGREELVHLEDDPLEVQPCLVDGSLEAQHREPLRRLRAALDAAEREEVAQPGAPVAPAGIGAEDVDALEAQMRLLGYL